jgi:hypothetical protein
MEENYPLYAEMLRSEISFGVIILCAIGLLFIAAAIFCVRMKQRGLGAATITICAVLLFSVYLFAFYPFQKDIDEKAYVVYEGVFHVEECYHPSRSGTYIRIQEAGSGQVTRYKVLSGCDVTALLDDTTYQGYFVYTQNGKALVDMQAEALSDS